jgi:membrane protein DedA with SNARE-associated domain
MTEWVRQLVNNMGYAGLGFLTFLENIFPPLPSEVILPLGGYLVSQGQLTLLGVILAGTAGSLLGAVVLYYVGRQFSQERLEEWADRYGGWLLLTADDVQQAFDWFDRHGRKAVFFARLVPGVRSLISIPAGTCGMNLPPFLLYTAVGTALWSGALVYGGSVLGEQYQNLSRILQWASYVVIALLVGTFIMWVYKKKQNQQES